MLSNKSRKRRPMTSGTLRFSVLDEGQPGKKPTVTEGAGSRLRRLVGK